MQISLFTKRDEEKFKGNQTKVYKVAQPHSLESLGKMICQWSWSPIVFNDSYRKGTNFNSCDIVALDVDGGFSLEQAINQFQNDKHIIATSKNHQKDKNGVISDRYRVLLFLDKDVNSEEYVKVMKCFKQWHQFIDVSCVDTARFFFPCDEVVSINEEGNVYEVSSLIQRYDVTPFVTTYFDELNKVIPSTPLASKDKLTRTTMRWLLEGSKPGEWHRDMFKAVSNMRECGFDTIEVSEKIADLAIRHGNGAGLDEHDINLIEDVFNREPNERTKKFYEEWNNSEKEAGDALATFPSEDSEPVTLADGFDEFWNYITNKEKSMGTPTGFEGLDRMLGGGWRDGEVTILAGVAKVGKSSFVHSLVHYGLKQGLQMSYVSREMKYQTEVMSNLLSLEFAHNSWTVKKTDDLRQAYQSKVKDWNTLMFAKGVGPLQFDVFQAWLVKCVEKGVKFVIIDNLHYLLGVNDHVESARVILGLKTLAQQYGIHVVVIIQPTKLDELKGQGISMHTLKGGSSLAQIADSLLIIERHKTVPNVMTLKLDFCRHKLGKPGAINFQYDSETTSMTEVEITCEKEEEPAMAPRADVNLTIEKFHS